MDWNTIGAVCLNLLIKLAAAVAVLVIGRLLIKALLKLLEKGKCFSKTEPTVRRFCISFLNIACNILLAVSVVAILGIPMASIVAVIASAGVAVGLALQGALGNLAGGLMILIFKPFRNEDFIETSGFSGTVKEIGIFYTVLTTPDNKEVTIPNGTVMAASVINYSRNETRRVDLEFSVAYGSDVEQVRSILLGEADKHTAVKHEPAPFCRMTEQGESALRFTLRVWVDNAAYWQTRFDLNESIYNRLHAEGIQIPFPQMDIHIKEEKES